MSVESRSTSQLSARPPLQPSAPLPSETDATKTLLTWGKAQGSANPRAEPRSPRENRAEAIGDKVDAHDQYRQSERRKQDGPGRGL